VEEVFEKRKHGFFLDLAASDGVSDSNTYILEKEYQWTGICVEPNEYSYKSLCKNRQCICDDSCIDEKRGEVQFLQNGGLGGIVADDTDNNNITRGMLLERLHNRIVTKKTITLEDLLVKHSAPSIIDFFSLDVEGAEERILKSFPFSKYVFTSLCIERPTPKINELLFENGYLFVRKSSVINAFDSFYVHSSFKPRHLLKSEVFSQTPQKDW